jgi:hypothetical protein
MLGILENEVMFQVKKEGGTPAKFAIVAIQQWILNLI